MNIAVTNKEELVNEASRILFKEKAEKLSIRMIANNLGISVGVLYNYFPSKGRLILAVAENFWSKCFQADFIQVEGECDFIAFSERIYLSLFNSLVLFYNTVKREFASLSVEDRRLGLEERNEYMNRMKESFITVLHNDERVRNDIFSENFTEHDLIDILFDNFLMYIDKGVGEFRIQAEILKRILY